MCVWLGGVVTFFQRYNPFKAQTTPSKTKNICFYVGLIKKIISKSNTLLKRYQQFNNFLNIILENTFNLVLN
jgi:hypothetical protein